MNIARCENIFLSTEFPDRWNQIQVQKRNLRENAGLHYKLLRICNMKRTDLSIGTDLKYRQTPVFAPQSLHWETVQSSRSWKKFHISSISTGRFSGISPYGTGHSAEQGVQRAVCSGARCVTGTRRNSVTDSSITFRTPAFRH